MKPTHWALWIVTVLLAAAALEISAFAYLESRRPVDPPPVYQVMEVDDPRVATYQMLLGRALEDRENLVELVEQQGRWMNLAIQGYADLWAENQALGGGE